MIAIAEDRALFRRFLAALAVLFLAVSAQAETMRVHSPGDGFLNLRTGPGSRYRIVIEMDHNTYVETLERAGNWVRLRHESGAIGWAHRRYLRPLKPLPVRYRVHSPRDGYLNLRTGPGTRFAIITPMYNGTRVQILERSGNWVRIYTEDGDDGWAHARYLVR